MLCTYHSERRKPYRISALQFPGMPTASGYLNILPGSQDVALAHLKAIANTPAYALTWDELMGEGIIELRTASGVYLHSIADVLKIEEADLLSEPGLESYRPYQAVQLVEQTIDLALLKRWKVEVTHSGISNAIDAQIAKLTAPGDTTAEAESERTRVLKQRKQAIAASEG